MLPHKIHLMAKACLTFLSQQVTKLLHLQLQKFTKEVAKKAATAGVEKFAVSGAEALGKSAADKVVNKLSAPSIVKENRPSPNSGAKIVNSLKKLESLPAQSSEIENLKKQLSQFM